MDYNYYSTIYTWFEKFGIISNTRTHLRQNLINTLKHKDPRLCKNREIRLAKQYVYDMLIAEYLFNHNYSFTLSIFASEVPLLVNFYDSISEHSANKDRNIDNTFKLQSDYIVHILETLGINPNRPEGQHIISNYMNDKAPLLLSILNYVVSFIINTPASDGKSSSFDKETQAKLALEINNIDTVKMYEKENYTTKIKKKIICKKQKYDDEMKIKETKLKQQASIIKYQFKSLNAKVEEAQNLMQSLMKKQFDEKKDNDVQCILQKEMELSMKQHFLLQETKRLQKERDSYRKFEYDLKKLQRELIKMQKEISQSAPIEHHNQMNVKNICMQTNLENRMIIDEYKAMQQERLELLNLVQEQRLRIEQITLRSVQLLRQLEEARSLQSVGVKIPISMAQVISANTVVSESSSTEDILQDAKMRLKRLEEESSKADQYFCNFISTSS